MRMDIYSKGICFCSVCTDAEDLEEMTKRVNQENPTGVTPWQISEQTQFQSGESNPCPCLDTPGNRHFLMEC